MQCRESIDRKLPSLHQHYRTPYNYNRHRPFKQKRLVATESHDQVGGGNLTIARHRLLQFHPYQGTDTAVT